MKSINEMLMEDFFLFDQGHKESALDEFRK